MKAAAQNQLAYVDTSLLVAALSPEDARHDVALSWIGRYSGVLVTSVLAEVELGRALSRRQAPKAARLVANQLLAGCELVEISQQIRARAVEVRPGMLRSLDAIHIATALVAGIRQFATYDRRQQVAAEEMGLIAA